MSLLQGVRVLDASTVIAAPFAAALMGDFGAEVIKVEMPGKGDPFRALGPYHDKKPMRWATMGRNKKSITLDLRNEKGKALFLRLVEKSDVLIENFRTGTMDKWGLDIDTLHKANPKLVVTRVTGYGQTGPYAMQAGFGTPATAFSGMLLSASSGVYFATMPESAAIFPSGSLTKDAVPAIITLLYFVFVPHGFPS